MPGPESESPHIESAQIADLNGGEAALPDPAEAPTDQVTDAEKPVTWDGAEQFREKLKSLQERITKLHGDAKRLDEKIGDQQGNVHPSQLASLTEEHDQIILEIDELMLERVALIEDVPHPYGPVRDAIRKELGLFMKDQAS